ncbi:bifunctional diguanylate cyclase/phosphodiesterase [Sporosarcina cascadiensis]|uniref:bifunctional diguanylate cyclase/phosphodiesterase n=1 Tax=Sporosarcina cascadiensis TaxID=2660747 RepID=UPI00189143D8|nr:EAL domain-containing protein [Sporosarcina cascadiensis]
MKMTKNSWLKMILPLVIAGFLVLTISDYLSTKKALKIQIEEETIDILNSFISEVDTFTTRRIGDVELMADYIPYIAEDKEEIAKFLIRQHEIMDYFSALGFITPDGNIIADDGSKLEVTKKESFKRALQGEILISEVFPLAQDPEIKVSSIVVPAENESGEVIGVLSGLINIEDIIRDITNSFNLPGAVYFVKDSEVVYSYPINRHTAFSYKDQLEQIEREKYGTILMNDSGHLLKYGQTVSGWTVIADSLDNPKLDELSAAFIRMFLLVSLIVSVGIIIYYYISYVEKQADVALRKDLLTGLPNRLKLREDINRKNSEWARQNLAVYFIRLDRFSDLMKKVGYQTADQLLQKTSGLLDEYERRGRLYRIDSEQFLFVIESACQEGAMVIGEELVQLLRHKIVAPDDSKIHASVSVGGVMISQNANEETLGNGVYACQEASKAGGNQFLLYDEAMDVRNKELRKMARCLSKALELNEFYMVYQPIYSIDEKRIVGFESLIRWNSAELGEIGPFHFIPLLEEDDAIIETGRWIMRTAALQAIEWRNAGYERFTINVNVSVKQLHHAGFLDDVYEMLEETGVDPSILIFEVTESVIVDDVGSVVRILQTLNEIGIKTAVDDFGTGYSSLSSLTTLPFQYLKVDKAFIDDVERREPGSEAILKGIIHIAKALNQTTVLEGVETLEQLQLLKSFGAQRIQGYFISKPLRVEDAVHLIGKEMEW